VTSGPQSGEVSQAWTALGRRLAALRKAAGYKQVTLALAVGYARSTVGNAESGSQRVARRFWTRCDHVLNADGRLVGCYDRIRAVEQGLHHVGKALQALDRQPPATPFTHRTKANAGDQLSAGPAAAPCQQMLARACGHVEEWVPSMGRVAPRYPGGRAWRSSKRYVGERGGRIRSA
jgi:DNA-binding XRE family transcriptional regulator